MPGKPQLTRPAGIVNTAPQMTDSTPTKRIPQVYAQLSKTWEFLAGESREFEWVHTDDVAPQCADFNYFMAMHIFPDGRTGGVGVLVTREDAQRVAAHMFGAPPDTLPEADLQDACSEVCNVFSEAISTIMTGNDSVKMELPFRALAPEYEMITQKSTVAALFHSCREATHLYILIYDVFVEPL